MDPQGVSTSGKATAPRPANAFPLEYGSYYEANFVVTNNNSRVPGPDTTSHTLFLS